MEEMPKPERQGAHPIFVAIYLILFVGVSAYPAYLNGVSLSSYGFDSLLPISGYLVPAFFFSLIGILSVRGKNSVIIALVGALISFAVLIFLVQVFNWQVF
ncbi:hypothetical protein HN709_00895 [Candidatus Peregrinibacteria bacterium]|nr:hypothetical protein [Candidatus Peregrinibacteria bacterium]MBT7736222.1 hypothetical protein [Candidatus Peregrinibacteria bacterium]